MPMSAMPACWRTAFSNPLLCDGSGPESEMGSLFLAAHSGFEYRTAPVKVRSALQNSVLMYFQWHIVLVSSLLIKTATMPPVGWRGLRLFYPMACGKVTVLQWSPFPVATLDAGLAVLCLPWMGSGLWWKNTNKKLNIINCLYVFDYIGYFVSIWFYWIFYFCLIFISSRQAAADGTCRSVVDFHCLGICKRTR